MEKINSVMSYILQGILPTITVYEDKGWARLVNEEDNVSIAVIFLVMTLMILCAFKIIIPEMKAMYHWTVANINDILETLRWILHKEDAVHVRLEMGSNESRTKASVRLNELTRCDAVLRLEDGGVFPVHRDILSMCSEYFRTLFTTSLHTSEVTDVLLHGVSSDMMTQILDYVYFREVDIRSDNARQLLVTADYLWVPGVPKLCRDFLMDEIDADNCVDIMQFARRFFITDLETRARRFVQRHFVKLSQQRDELLELSAEELRAIIESEDLNVKDEKVVWECILRWINHDTDNRKGHIAGLLTGVRTGILDAKFFKEEVSKHPYVMEIEACRPVVSETLKFLQDLEMMTKEDKEFVTPRIAYPRIPQDILFAVGGYDHEGRLTDVIEAYDARADRWSVVEGIDSIGPRANHRTAVVGFDIYVIGGFDGRDSLCSCFCFNAVTKTCREVAPMLIKYRWGLSVAVLRGSVYGIGGYNFYDYHRTAERYDCKANQWSLIAPMNTGRSNASAAVLNDKIYVAGGYDGVNYLNSVEGYDPDTEQWTFVAPMLSQRVAFSCVEFHGCLYVLGGQNKTLCRLRTEKYDPAEDTWTEIPGMNFYSYNLNAEVMDDKIFVIYHYYNQDDFFNRVVCFSDKENRWHQAADMNVRRRNMSTCVIENLPNASDYAYKHREKLMKEKRKKMLDSNPVARPALVWLQRFLLWCVERVLGFLTQ